VEGGKTVTLLLKPKRGGFLRPFGCGWFIREFLQGEGPYESPKIDSEVGSPQADIFHHYKMALMRMTALDRATRVEEKRARQEKRSINPENIESLSERFHSFIVYFSTIQRLGWVEATGQEEPSSFQEHYSPGQPRKYFRLTKAGKEAGDTYWANPQRALYGGH
jgi:hypothetical protein